MKSFLIILALLLAAILQITLVPFLAFKGVSPNLVLLLISFLVIFKGFQQSWWLVILAGLFLDLFSGLPFGLISLSLLVTVYLIDLFNRNVFSVVRFWVMTILIISATLIYDLLLFGLSRIFQIDSVLGPKYLFIEIVYNLLLTVIFFYGAKKVLHQK